jgi:hypothetical protein
MVVAGWEDEGDGGHGAGRVGNGGQYASMQQLVLHKAGQRHGLEDGSSWSYFFEFQAERLPERNRAGHEFAEF